MRLPAGAEGFPPRLRALSVEVDPTLRLDGVETLVEATSGPRDFYAFWTTILVAVCALARYRSGGRRSASAWRWARRAARYAAWCCRRAPGSR